MPPIRRSTENGEATCVPTRLVRPVGFSSEFVRSGGNPPQLKREVCVYLQPDDLMGYVVHGPGLCFMFSHSVERPFIADIHLNTAERPLGGAIRRIELISPSR